MNTENPDCKHEAGLFKPVVNRNRCEGKADCVTAYPYQVFTIGTLTPQERQGLSLIGRIKGYAHQWQQAFAINADACHACGLCVTACPEKAITLSRA
mgnify:CR=1 FL=1